MTVGDAVAVIILLLVLLFAIYYFNIANIRHYINPTSFTVDGVTVTNYNKTAKIPFITTLQFKLVANPNSQYLLTVCNETKIITTNIIGETYGYIELSYPCKITVTGPGISTELKVIVGNPTGVQQSPSFTLPSSPFSIPSFSQPPITQPPSSSFLQPPMFSPSSPQTSPPSSPPPTTASTYVLVNGHVLTANNPIITLFKVTSLVITIHDGPQEGFTVTVIPPGSTTYALFTNSSGVTTIRLSLSSNQNYQVLILSVVLPKQLTVYVNNKT